MLKIIGQSELDDMQIKTFLSVDFYNHESKSSDKYSGAQPIYNTLFSFKNTVDDFYLRYLQSELLVVDVIGEVGSKVY